MLAVTHPVTSTTGVTAGARASQRPARHLATGPSVAVGARTGSAGTPAGTVMHVTLDAPVSTDMPKVARTARVAVVRTRPEHVLADYGRVMDLAGYRDTIPATATRSSS